MQPLIWKNGAAALIEALSENKLDKVRPHLEDSGAIVYSDAVRITGIGSSEVAEILEDLAEDGLLFREPSNPILKCPSCGSVAAAQSLVCPNCDATDLISGATIQHLPCLNFDFGSNFETRNGSRFCRKCERRLLRLGYDYLEPGTFFKCLGCGEFTARALRSFTCNGCQRIFRTAKEAAIQTYEYELNRKNPLISTEYRPIDFVREISNSAIAAGFGVCNFQDLKGRSGAMHSFTLLIASRSGDESGQHMIAIDVVSQEQRVNVSSMLSLFAKSLDCRLKNRVLIAIPELSNDARLVARRYNIPYLETLGRSMKMFEPELRSLLATYSPTRDAQKVRSESPSTNPTRPEPKSRKRSSFDIMADILVVVSRTCSKAEVMASANLSYDQVQKYLPALQKLKLVNEYIEDRSHSKWIITEKGLEYLQCTLTEYGRIAKGQHSIWSMERETPDNLAKRASET